MGKKTYEELSGGYGRAVTFRADRHLVGDITTRGLSNLVIDDVEYPLYDVAMNGVSFLAESDGTGWEIGDEFDLSIRVQAITVYRGRGRVARQERTRRRRRIGVQLLTGFLDLPEMRWQAGEEALVEALESGAGRTRSFVPTGYREVIEQAVHFVQYYRRVLDEAEQRYVESGSPSSAVDTLAQRAVDALRAPWNLIRERGAREAVPLLSDPVAQRAAKLYTEQMLTTLMIDAPVIERSYNKPLGYAGDFQTMAYIYKDALEGPSVFARVFHKLAVEEPLATGVRTRKDLMLKLTIEEYERVRRESPNRSVQITNLGCGLAREVSEFVEDGHARGPSVHWTLIDQEEEALSLAYHEVYQRIAEAHAPASLRCLYLSFGQMLADPANSLVEKDQDFTYAVGIFDYLPKTKALELISAMWAGIAPGGLLAIGNASKPNVHFWLGEYVLDWSLLFRSREDMMELAQAAPDATEVKVVTEASNAYHFLLLRKP